MLTTLGVTASNLSECSGSSLIVLCLFKLRSNSDYPEVSDIFSISLRSHAK